MALNEIVYTETPVDGQVPVYSSLFGAFVASAYPGLSVLTYANGVYPPRLSADASSSGHTLYVGPVPPVDGLDGDIWLNNPCITS